MPALELIKTTLYTDANLTYYWQFEGNSNTTTGSDNGTDTNITYSAGNGKFNQGAGFNGTNSKISIATPLSGTGDFTLLGWFKTGTAARQALFFAGDNTINKHAVQVYLYDVDTYKLHVDLNASSGPATTLGSLDDGIWHMLTVVGASGNLTIYVDGGNSATTNGNNWNFSSKAGVNFFGMQDNGTSNPLNGAMDDFAIFSRALSSTEISNHWNGLDKISTVTPVLNLPLIGVG